MTAPTTPEGIIQAAFIIQMRPGSPLHAMWEARKMSHWRDTRPPFGACEKWGS